MSKITIQSINEELKGTGWHCEENQEYKNLDSQLQFTCDEGHTVFSTWKKIRAKRICPTCSKNEYKSQDEFLKPEQKQKGVTRILALDQATHTCGWSIFDGTKLVRYGTFTTNLKDEIARDNTIKMWMISMINGWKPDHVALEGIQFQDESSGKKISVTVFQALARLQGILMEACYELKQPFDICPTNTWRGHCGVKGRQRADKKRSMQLLAKNWYDITVTDDEADAIGIGKYMADLHDIKVVSWE